MRHAACGMLTGPTLNVPISTFHWLDLFPASALSLTSALLSPLLQMSDSSSLSRQAEIVRFSIAVASAEQAFLAHVAGQVPVATWSQIATDIANNSSTQSAQNGTTTGHAANSTLRRSLLSERSLAQFTPSATASAASNSSVTSWDNDWFLANGYALTDLTAYVAAHDLAAAHPNRAKDLQINGFSYFRYHLPHPQASTSSWVGRAWRHCASTRGAMVLRPQHLHQLHKRRSCYHGAPCVLAAGGLLS
jgi:hypothetical protein